MPTVDELLSAPLLGDDAAGAFQRSRERVVARHRNWRVNFPAFGLLLDTDEERAHALAGNYATEARETVGVWLRAQEESADLGARDNDALIGWVEDFWHAWRRQILESEEFEGLEAAPKERFRRIFDDLTERFREEAVAHLRNPAPRAGPRSGGAAALLRPFVGAAALVRGFFFPGARLD